MREAQILGQLGKTVLMWDFGLEKQSITTGDHGVNNWRWAANSCRPSVSSSMTDE
ncbi:MAG: hypothetical protein ACYC2T_10445 [Bacillota bacterium]